MSKYLEKKNGGALVLVLIVMLIFTILGATILRIASSEKRFVTLQENKHKAYYLARAGAQSIAEYMIKDADKNKPASDLINKKSISNKLEEEDGEFSIDVRSVEGSNDVLITSIGDVSGVKQTAKIRLTGVPLYGIGGVFNHAIAAVDLIYAGNGNASGTSIIGSVASKNNDIPEYILDKTTEGGKKDSTLVFPSIILPDTFDYDWHHLSLTGKNDIQEVITNKNTPKYVRADSITIKQGKLSIRGDGDVHIYIDGGTLTLETQAQIYADPEVRVYIYVVPPASGTQTILFQGSGNYNSLFLYAPEATVEWNNSKAGEIDGSIIAKVVKLHNHTQIKYNGALAIDAELDKVVVGVSYEGYVWED